MTADPTWITVEDVRAALGMEPSSGFDETWLEMSTAAAQNTVADLRAGYGYADDPATVPSSRVHMGCVAYAVELYASRNAHTGNAASFDELSGLTLVPMSPTVKKLVGVPRAVAV